MASVNWNLPRNYLEIVRRNVNTHKITLYWPNNSEINLFILFKNTLLCAYVARTSCIVSLMLIPKPFESRGVGFRGYELFLQIFVSASRHCHEGLKSGFRFMLHPANENNNAGRAHAMLGTHATSAHCRPDAILVIGRMTRALSFVLCRQFAIAQIRRLPYHCRFNCNFPTRAKIAHPRSSPQG